MFKYSPINSYSLQNLHNNQIYFNNPLDFNDPFDTFHPANIEGLSNETLASLIRKFYKRDFNEKHLIDILNGNISKSEFYEFSKEHIDYFFKFDEENDDSRFKSKQEYLNIIRNTDDSTLSSLSPEIREIFEYIKGTIQNVVTQSIERARKDIFSKIGVCCFSKNKTNLLMWSHYSDSHRGICMEFDPNLEPFSKNFEVIYGSNVPRIESDSLFREEYSFELFRKLLSYKSDDWGHEEEIRLLHKEKNKLFRYPRHALKAIYFGIRSTRTDIEIVCSLVKAQNYKVRFYQMNRLESSFGIEPNEIFYSTPVEVQSKLLLEIFHLFNNRKFLFEELFEKVKSYIEEENLRNHLEELVRTGILEKEDSYYKLNA